MASKHILSKSTFMYGCQCPKRLYLHKFKPELRNPEDEQQESVFATGTDVGLLARELFPNGVSAEPPNAFSYHIAVEKTAKYISQQHSVIYEAAFNFEGVMCAIDILVKKKNKWYAFEVKGSTKVKEPFVLDASLQHYVISNSGLPLEDISIVYLNNQYVRQGKLEIKKLFANESILEQVVDNKDFIEQKISELKLLLKEKKEPVIEVGKQCYKPYECDFINHCWANVADESSAGEKYINKKSIREFLAEWKYPYLFFDFETIMPAVPEYNLSRPYQQIPFQYSVHIQKSKNEEPEHHEFLGDGISDPREELIKDMLNKLGKKGSIIVWNKSFEISRLKELARDFPKYAKVINSLINRIVDLIIPFRSGWYSLPEFNGSASLKSVLPAMIPELSYGDLEIQEGGTASLVYYELRNQTLKIQELHRKNLLDYCKLDTLAMVKIWEKLNRL